MDWFTSTDSDLAVLEDSTLDDYTDGIPDSYELTQWYGSQDYPISTLTDSEMADLIDGRTPYFTPFRSDWVNPEFNPGFVFVPELFIVEA